MTDQRSHAPGSIQVSLGLRPAFHPSPDLYPFKSRWFRSSVGMVHYIDEGEGRPLLLLHGNPTWSFLYREIVRELRGTFRCIAPDYPGFGLSERPPGYTYSPAEQAGIVRELVEHLNLKSLVVMGQDWGGPIGMAVASAMPDRIAGLVFGNTWCWPTDRRFNRLFSHAMSSRLGRWAILRRNVFVERLIPAGTTRKLTADEMDHYRRAQPTPEYRLGIAEFPRQLIRASTWLQETQEAAVGRLIGTPLLLTWGMKDPAFSPAWCLPRWKQLFPDHELVELPEARHYIQEDAPWDIAAAIARKFAQEPTGSHSQEA